MFRALDARLKAAFVLCAVASVAVMVAAGRLPPVVAGAAVLFAIGLRRILLATALTPFVATSLLAPPRPADGTAAPPRSVADTHEAAGSLAVTFAMIAVATLVAARSRAFRGGDRCCDSEGSSGTAYRGPLWIDFDVPAKYRIEEKAPDEPLPPDELVVEEVEKVNPGHRRSRWA